MKDLNDLQAADLDQVVKEKMLIFRDAAKKNDWFPDTQLMTDALIKSARVEFEKKS